MTRLAPTGILGFPVTPFNEKNEVDTSALKHNIQFQLDAGVEAIFVACGAGEYHAISNEEYEAIVEVGKEAVNGAVPLYTGVGGNITEAVGRANISKKHGVDGYLIMPPYLVQGGQEGIYQYFHTIATSTDLNAIVYHRDNAVMSLETIEKLADTPQIVGFKDGHGDMELAVEFTQELGNKISWLNGMPLAEVTMPSFAALGFDSYSSAISNYIPHISRKYYEALRNGDQETVHELYLDVILPINRIRRQGKGYAISLIKAGMEIVGLPVDSKNLREPVTPITPEHYNELKEILEKVAEKYPNNLEETAK